MLLLLIRRKTNGWLYIIGSLKLAMGIIGLVLQINLMGKGNLAPTSAMDQVQNYVLAVLLVGNL